MSLNLEIQDRTDVLEETCDLDLVDLATWFTPSVNQTPKPSESLKQDRAESKDNRGSQEPKDWSRVNEKSSRKSIQRDQRFLQSSTSGISLIVQGNQQISIR